MIAKFSEAFRLLWRHFGLFAAIILTVWLPGNLFLVYFDYNVATGTDAALTGAIKISMWIELIFGPIYIGAMVFALFQIKSGKAVAYREAIAVGFRKWGSLFAARFVAGFLTGLGLVALIVPGIMLAVRYSLLDSVVVLEQASIISNPRERSTELTEGKRWQIFWSAILFYIPFLMLSFALYLPLESFESFNIIPVEVALDCLLDIIYAVIQIVIFLFYWEATEPERQTADPVVAPMMLTENPGIADGPPPTE